MNNHSFSAEFFAANRERLRQLFPGTAPIVITAHAHVQRSADLSFGFQQDANFWYLTGLDVPEALLVMDKAKEYLIVPQREGVRAAFDGAFDFADIASRSGVEVVYGVKEGWKLLASRLKKVKHVATIAAPPAYLEFYTMYANPARAELIKHMKEVNDSLEVLDIREHLGRLRRIKQPVEIQAIQQAIDITIDSIKYASRPARLHKYAHEYEVEADITSYFRKHGAKGHAFEPIIAGGDRASVIHYVENSAALSSDELLMFDIGAEFDHYAADISRTVSISGKPSRRQQAVHKAVCEVQDFALNLLKPGVIVGEYERQIEQYMGEKLRELGLIKNIVSEEVRQYYPHATSHYLGIDVHDVGPYDQPLAPGVVITCEPGIYIPEEGIGVRIEDDILITEQGHENLTGRLSRELV